jgi:DNA-binding LacI/PurR family transcriptional regulator
MQQIRTMKELAELAGVTAGTVSRALAGSPLISADTRERIQTLARDHGFRLNVVARNLRTQKTGAIGVLIPLGHEKRQHISDPFFITMLGYLADRLTENGFDLLLSRVIPEDDGWLDRHIGSGKTDGVIVIGQSDQTEILDRTAKSYRPLVIWGGHDAAQAHCTVGSDNVLGGDMAATHLIERGCQRIAFFGDPRAVEIGQRLEGCRRAMARAGLADSLTVMPAHLTAEEAHPDITRFLGSASERPQGIVAASDVVAMSALRVLAELGLSVPGDVSVIGYDGLDLGEHTVPRLSTISQDLKAGAAMMVDLLLRRIAGEDTQSVVLPPKLIVRMSS